MQVIRMEKSNKKFAYGMIPEKLTPNDTPDLVQFIRSVVCNLSL